MIYSYYTNKKLSELDDHSLSFGIANNILDSAFQLLQYPFELLREKDSWTYKKEYEEYELIIAFVSIATAIELLMKSKIALKKWSLLFKNPEKATRDSVINADFKSINFETCVKLIEGEYHILLDNRLKSRLDVIRTTRNKITHFYHSISKSEITNLIAFGLDIYIDFYRQYIRGDVYDDSDRTEDFEVELASIHEFVESRIESSKKREGPIRQSDKDLNPECQKCWTCNLVITKNGEVKCLYCGAIIDVELYAEDWADPDTEITECDICKKRTMISRLSKKHSCIICGKEQ